MDAKQAIARTVETWAPGADPGALLRIAQRESAFIPTAIGDSGPGSAGERAYARMRDRLVNSGNPWAEDASRWSGSFGLYQMMPAYFIGLWDVQADPYVMFDPVIATAIAGRYWNRGVRAGATDFVRMRLFWANPSWVSKSEYDPEYKKRLSSKLSEVDGVINPPTARYRYDAFGVGPQSDQAQMAARARGGATTPTRPTSDLSLPLFALAAWSVFKAWKNGA